METWSLTGGSWVHRDDASAEARWFDVAGEPDGLQALALRYGLHPLAVEDCLSPLLHAPKVDDFGDYLFILVQGLINGIGGPQLEELNLFLGKGFLITYHDRPLDVVAEVDEGLGKRITVRPGVDGLFHAIVDRFVDDLLPQLQQYSEQLETIQDSVLASPRAMGGKHRSILEIRARAGDVRRIMSPQMTVFQRLARGEFEQIHETNLAYFRDVYDHLVRVDLMLEGIREDAEMAIGTYLSAVNNQMSEVMKVLSVVAALALPATVIAGIFGTNFDNVPLLHTELGFASMLGSMVALAGGMGLYFRRRGWF